MRMPHGVELGQAVDGVDHQSVAVQRPEESPNQVGTFGLVVNSAIDGKHLEPRILFIQPREMGRRLHDLMGSGELMERTCPKGRQKPV